MKTKEKIKNIFNKKEKDPKVKKRNDIIFYTTVGIIIFMRIFIMSPIRVNGPSMEPTLKHGEFMILNKLDMRKNGIDRFDVVVFKSHGAYLIKRVIGLPGETLYYKDDQLYINSKKVDDKYSRGLTGKIITFKLEDDEYFVLGDNRPLSQDSRMLGPIHKLDIKGKANFMIYPFDKFGEVEK